MRPGPGLVSACLDFGHDASMRRLRPDLRPEAFALPAQPPIHTRLQARRRPAAQLPRSTAARRTPPLRIFPISFPLNAMVQPTTRPPAKVSIRYEPPENGLSHRQCPAARTPTAGHCHPRPLSHRLPCSGRSGNGGQLDNHRVDHRGSHRIHRLCRNKRSVFDRYRLWQLKHHRGNRTGHNI